VAFPAAGIGITYLPQLEPLLAEAGVVDVLEIEPQIFWTPTDDPAVPVRSHAIIETYLRSLPQAKSVHSVGCAVGGSKPPAPANVALLAETVRRLDPVIVSEHLSFDRAGEDADFSTRFFLPPLQTHAGVATAAANIVQLMTSIGRELAVETGVNYLAPQPGQMSDGRFVAEVVDAAQCGILLDVHNIWTNEMNGRQAVREFIAEIPLDRIWEIHVAGGFEHRGYWLDAHAGAVPEPVLDLVATIVPQLPNLRVATFEIVPEFASRLGAQLVRDQVEALRRACENTRLRTVIGVSSERRLRRSEPDTESARLAATAPSKWENSLAAAVVGLPSSDPIPDSIEHDTGIGLLRELVAESRAGAVAAALPLTVRLLLLTLGSADVRRILSRFWRKRRPEPFTASEGLHFADHLRDEGVNVDYLDDVLAYETTTLDALLTDQALRVTLRYDPDVVLQALTKGTLPINPVEGTFVVDVGPQPYRCHTQRGSSDPDDD
jgi:uncharacterized protein